jgi:hypothetical protein
MATNKVIVQGGGGHARVVLDVLLSQGIVVPALVDSKYKGDLFGVPRIDAYNPSFEVNASAVVAIGDNVVRKRVAQSTKHAFTNVIHGSAIISTQIKMGVGNMVLHGTIVQGADYDRESCYYKYGSTS